VSAAAATTSPPDGDGPAVRPRFATSAATTYFTSVAVSVVSLVNVMITARALEATGRGQIALLITIPTLTATLALLGVDQATVNIAGREPATRRAIATDAVIIAGGLGVAAASLIAGLLVVFPAAGGDLSPPLLAIALAAIPVLIVRANLQALLQADYHFGIGNATRLLSPVTGVVVNGALALAGVLTVGSAIATWIAGQALGVVVLAVVVVRRGSGFGRPDAALARRMLSFGARSHVGRVMNLGNYRLDQWFVGTMAGSRELGLYSVAVAWSEALFFLPTALASVQRPDLVRADRGEAVRRAGRVFRLALLLTAPMALGLIVTAPWLCTTIFGPDFAGAVGQLRVLALGAFGIVAVKLLGDALTAQRLPLLSSVPVAFGLVFTVVLDLLLIPHHGGMGAAIASTVAYTVAGIAACVTFARALGARRADLMPRVADLRTVRTTLRRRSARRQSTRETTATGAGAPGSADDGSGPPTARPGARSRAPRHGSSLGATDRHGRDR
jgi:O-antigen/teichoic acid export membrane protein